MLLPSVEDVRNLLEKAKEENFKFEKPDDAADILEKWLNERYLSRRDDHIAQLAAWGPKTVGDAEGEFGEVAALMSLSLKALRAAQVSSKEDFQFEVVRRGLGKDCLVMPPSNFAFLGMKDIFHMLLQGFRVVAVVQPRFFSHFREVQQDLSELGLPKGMLEILPGITPEADPAVLHELLRRVDRLQFTGSSPCFVASFPKHTILATFGLQHAGEVSGLNLVRLAGVSGTHPAVVQGAAWAAMANNGELCTSASLLSYDPATGDTSETVKAALEKHQFKFGRDPTDTSINVLLKDGKSSSLEVKVASTDSEINEWWEKTLLVVPKDGVALTRTNQSLGHCIFAPTFEEALAMGVKEDASNIYCVGVPKDVDAPFARAGTTGAKLPNSVFGGNKTFTFAVAGDHDGVGTAQTLLEVAKRRGASWRDSEEVVAKYELTETAEMLLEFLSPREQTTFQTQISHVLEVYKAFYPEVEKPYGGQGLVGGDGPSQLVTLKAIRPVRKNVLVPRGVELSEDVVKLAMLCDMSPLREIPVNLHLMHAGNAKLRVADPMKSFLRVVQKRLGWNVSWYETNEQLETAVRNSEYPPYFFCAKDRSLIPKELSLAVISRGGYFYEGLPSDALGIFRLLTTTQAWTISCTEAQVDEAGAALTKMWRTVGLREVAHEAPEFVKPTKRREDDIGGGFGASSASTEDWGALSSDSESSDSSDDDESKKTAVTEGPKIGNPANATEGKQEPPEKKLEKQDA